MQSNEIWKPIPEYEGVYEISNTGSVKRLAGGSGARPGRMVATFRSAGGHVRVGLSYRGRTRGFFVHRLVLAAFVGPCPEGMEGCHNNGVPDDNRIENLRWDTRSANQRDAVRHGQHASVKKDACNRGHQLRAPNLVANVAANGYRLCLACTREKTNSFAAGRAFSPAEADRNLERILHAGPGRRTTASGIRGVTRDRELWRARMRVNGRQVYLGGFATAERAAAAVAAKRAEMKMEVLGE